MAETPRNLEAAQEVGGRIAEGRTEEVSGIRQEVKIIVRVAGTQNPNLEIAVHGEPPMEDGRSSGYIPAAKESVDPPFEDGRPSQPGKQQRFYISD